MNYEQSMFKILLLSGKVCDDIKMHLQEKSYFHPVLEESADELEMFLLKL